MPAVNTALVVGAGTAGLAVAIDLARAGVDVEVCDRLPEVSALGSGITLQGNALRCLDALGVGDAVRDNSSSFNVLSFRDKSDGRVLATVDGPRAGGPDYPAAAGMYRPTLARILAERAVEVGVRFRWNADVVGIGQDDDLAHVDFADGSSATAEVVVGADGLNSVIRPLLGIDERPEALGMGIWRAFVPRPAEITHAEIIYGGPAFYVGYTPTGPDEMYAYVVDELSERIDASPEELCGTMREFAEAYPGVWQTIAASLDGTAQVNYTAITRLLVSAPWNRGRIVLIGDAAHSCPPTLAQGAAQALEDAAVLAEVLIREPVLDDRVWDSFNGRRIPRAGATVESSITLTEWQREGRSGPEAAELMGRVADLLAEPA